MNLQKKMKNKRNLIIKIVLVSVIFFIISSFGVILSLLLGTSIQASLEQYHQNQALDNVQWILSVDGKAMIPANYLPLYQEIGKKYGVPWPLLAAIHKVETNFGRNLSESNAGAVGHYQFMKCNWLGWNYYAEHCNRLGNFDSDFQIDLTDPENLHGGQAVDENGDGKIDPNHIEDSMAAAAKRLAGDKQRTGKDWFERGGPVWRYNPAQFYVDRVKKYFDLFATSKLINNASGLIYKGGKFPWPTAGRVTAPFGEWRGTHMHAGVDIGAPNGTPIYSVADGVVVKSKADPGGYGWYVVIRHGQMDEEKQIDTLYGHMYPNTVKVIVGNKVKKGQIIAAVGSNGRSTGPHLHFEVQINGKVTDPMDWIQ